MFKDYYTCRAWLESFIPQTYSRKNLGLERINYLLKLLGNPQNKFKSIHVAGTSGKGSTAFYISQLLRHSGRSEYSENSVSQKVSKPESQKARKSENSDKTDTPTFRHTEYSESSGLKIGLHVSPHLSYIGERMQILESQKSKVKSEKSEKTEEISIGDLIKLINQIKPIVEKIQKQKPDLTPSYFEILVAASFKYFAEEKVDWAVVEVGLGGRLDATNVLRPKICVITNIGLDHTDILGKSIEKIAKEKAGIIKEGVPIVTGASGRALEVIKKVAKSKKAPLINLSTLLAKNHPKSDMFRYISKSYYLLRDSQNGFASFNKNLALLTVLTLLSLLDHEVAKQSFLIDRHVASLLAMTIDGDAAEKAFSTPFAGRFEEIVEGVVLDGAHNADKINYLINFVQDSKLETRNSKLKNIILIVAFKKGKNWHKMLDLLIKSLPVKKVIATEFHAPTDTGFFAAVNPRQIAKYAKRLATNVKIIENSQEAVFEAINDSVIASGTKQSEKKIATPLDSLGARNDRTLILVTGSLYLVGEARTLWHLPKF